MTDKAQLGPGDVLGYIVDWAAEYPANSFSGRHAQARLIAERAELASSRKRIQELELEATEHENALFEAKEER